MGYLLVTSDGRVYSRLYDDEENDNLFLSHEHEPVFVGKDRHEALTWCLTKQRPVILASREEDPHG